MGYRYGHGYGHTWKSKKAAVSAPAGPPAAPVNTVLPAISGTPTVGETITASTGSWTASPSPSYAYQWKRAGADISGATSSTYLLVALDTAALITVTVTATNASGSASATSASFGTINLTPSNAVLPVITGTTTVGQTLTSSTGTWAGTPVPTYAYQWKNAGVNISGATSSTYLLQASDEGDLITVTVTATNTAGSTSATSASVGPITSGAAVGGAALIVDETNAFAVDFMHTVDAERIAVKTAGTVVSSGTSFFTSSGTSSKWVYNASGVLVNVAAGTLPIDYNQGLMIEQAATDYMFPSSPDTAGGWVVRGLGTELIAAQLIGPSGTLTAAYVEDVTVTTQDIYRFTTGLGTSARYEPSCFIKKVTTTGYLQMQNAYTGPSGGKWMINFSLLGSGWERITRTHAALTIYNEFVSDGSGNGGVQFYAGDGVAKTFYLDFMQLEPGTFSTSPIPTTTTSVTRAADNHTFLLSTIPALGSDYSIYCRFTTPDIASARHVFALTDGTTNEYVGFLTDTTARLAVVDGGSAVGAITGASLTANTAVSLAARIKTNDCALSVGGSAVVTDTSVSLPAVTEVRFGGIGSNALTTGVYQLQKMIIAVPGWNNATLVTKSGS